LGKCYVRGSIWRSRNLLSDIKAERLAESVKQLGG
jgi:hypothetical protein